MDLDTWVSIGALIGTGLALATYLRVGLNQVRAEIKDARAEAKADHQALRIELRYQSTRIDRLYELLTRQGHAREA